MKNKLSTGKIAVIIIAAILIIDQLVKIWIKTHMHIGQEIHVLGDWFIIHFTENPGMAFGMRFGGEFGKLFLSLFRIALVVFIAMQMVKLNRKKAPRGVMIGLALILAGAAGNIFDSMFYGLFFDTGTTFNPELGGYQYYSGISKFSCGGYASFFHGCVVDMLYFPIINTTWPSWVPFVGGEELVFFRPIFNIADSAITIGVFYLLLFQRKFFTTKKEESGAPKSEEQLSF